MVKHKELKRQIKTEYHEREVVNKAVAQPGGDWAERGFLVPAPVQKKY